MANGRDCCSRPDRLNDLLAEAGNADHSATEERQFLLLAATRRAAYDILAELADDQGRFDLGNMPPLAPIAELADEIATENLRDRETQRLQIVTSLLQACEQADLARLDGAIWQLSEDCDLPDMADLLQLVLAEDPAWSADCVMLNHAVARMPQVLQTMPQEHGQAPRLSELYSHTLLEHYFASSPIAAAHIAQMQAICEAVVAQWPEGRPLRMLELGVNAAGLTKKLLPMIEAKQGLLVAADTNRSILDRLTIAFARSVHFGSVLLDDQGDKLEEFGAFDLIISANGLAYLDNGVHWLEKVSAKMAKNGLLLASLVDGSLYHDLVFGLSDGWFADSLDPTLPVGKLGEAQHWQSDLKSMAFDKVDLLAFANEHGEADLDGSHLLIARKVENENAQPEASNAQEGHVALLINDDLAEKDSLFANVLTSALRSNGTKVLAVSSGADWSDLLAQMDANETDKPLELIYCTGFDGSEQDAMALASLRSQQLGSLLSVLGDRKPRLWLMAPGGAPSRRGRNAGCATQSALWGFGRTAANEFGDLDIRLIDFDEAMGLERSAATLAAFVAQPGDEREVLLSEGAMDLVRATRGLGNKPDLEKSEENSQVAKGASILRHPRGSSLDRLHWAPTVRRAPQPGEVQIEVAGTGLNFRDVMWAQGLLPEEALEDGFAGPTLGFECSGLISAVGKGVTRFKLGDRVMALAPACFASHVTVEETGVSHVPDSMDLVAAASMPVAFLTSYYSLHHLARLEEGEWVLIHGAAGGVGLAAVQIAKWCGARIIATAGNDEKRDFLKMLGADYVLNTRSLDFVDQVRAITREANGPGKEGVDVVLNSLFGEAMERSLELVKPFGRFLELGKRDFYGNTKIGLRPFRRNISYFGIDADQLLNHQPERSRRLFADLARLFEKGQFTLLPYRLFASGDIVDAFRLMQQSGHIGKIIVKAPAPQMTSLAEQDAFRIDDKGHHILVGGLGGFGLEAAAWLAENGASSIVLTSRSGKITTEAQALFDDLAERQVSVQVKACDVTDEMAFASLLDDLRKDGPIKGVMHTAMVLDDAFIQNLTNDQIERVLAPKIKGGDVLDRLTRADDLDYFLLFSSISVLLGNPGQSHYVTANAYLDGLARVRKAAGLPALSVGWGAITDVGILAREAQTAETLAKTTGGQVFKARQALDRLVELVNAQRPQDMPAVVSLAPMNWAMAGGHLPVMSNPTFAQLAAEANKGGGQDRQAVDVPSLIEGLDDTAARDKIALLLAEEVATIFRMPVGDINLKRSLSDIGMDSLMGMELRSAAQQKLDIDIPMSAMGDGTCINDIAASVLERVRGGEEPEAVAGTSEMLLHQHGGDAVDAKQLQQRLDQPTNSGQAG